MGEKLDKQHTRIVIQAEGAHVTCTAEGVIVELEGADTASLLASSAVSREEGWVDIKTLARHRGVSERTVRNVSARLPHTDFGGRRFRLSAVDSFIEENPHLLRPRRSAKKKGAHKSRDVNSPQRCCTNDNNGE